MAKKTVVVLSGAGISAESGIRTFRDSNGLWEEHKVEDVATFDAWQKNKELVLHFYNERRKQVLEVSPNGAHYALAELQEEYNVRIITQNIDDLHERAGSNDILHLHGEILKARSTIDASLIYPIKGWEIKLGDKCDKGSQLRPHIVWFGEMVPEMGRAAMIAEEADVFVVIGTSLNVYPAAGLLHQVSRDTPKFLIDPGTFNLDYVHNLTHIQKTAVDGMHELVKALEKI
jgi:NAD-dependent deacetylase